MKFYNLSAKKYYKKSIYVTEKVPKSFKIIYKRYTICL